VGPAITPQIRPLNQAQRNEAQRRQNRNEVQKRMDLARERFNPSKLEFGLSELLFGR
jgi:ribosomal protein S30